MSCCLLVLDLYKEDYLQFLKSVSTFEGGKGRVGVDIDWLSELQHTESIDGPTTILSKQDKPLSTQSSMQ